MKKMVIIVLAIMLTSFMSAQAQMTLDSLKKTTVGKLVFQTDSIKTKKASSVEEANKMLSEGIKDILLIVKDVQGTIYIRFLVLADNRIIRIQNQMTPRFYFISSYLTNAKVDPDKLVECWITTEGKVDEIATNYGTDPKGKDGMVFSDKTVKSFDHPAGSGVETSITINGNPLISDQDPIVIRYQKEINSLLPLFGYMEQ